jgi:hypothetical protein
MTQNTVTGLPMIDATNLMSSIDCGPARVTKVLWKGVVALPMLISIYDGMQLLDTRECRVVSLPDGRQGAVWRGLAYAVLSPDARIDLSDQAFLPSACRIPEVADTTSSFALIEGDEEAYLLLSGTAAACETTAGVRCRHGGRRHSASRLAYSPPSRRAVGCQSP